MSFSEGVRTNRSGNRSYLQSRTHEGDVSIAGQNSKLYKGSRLAAATIMMLLAVILVFGNITSVYADDLVNTVPYNEAKPFYSKDINTGFVPNGYNTLAQYGPGYGPYTVKGVYQSLSSQSATTFAAGLPLGTIFIDQSNVKVSDKMKIEVVSKDTKLIAGLVKEKNGLMGYDGTKQGAEKLVPNKINRLDGDLFEVKFEDAAILPNGERADLVITYSNARIVIDQRYAEAPEEEQYLHGIAYFANANAFHASTSDSTNFSNVSYSTKAENTVNKTANDYGQSFSNNNSNKPSIGTSLDATYRIVKKDGTPAAGSFVFAICGINLDRDPDAKSGNNVGKPLWYSYNEDFNGENGKAYSFFSEAMSVNSGKRSDNIYVRPNNNLEDNPEASITDPKGKYFWANVSAGSDGVVKFISNAVNSVKPNLGGHDESYSAGFVTLADAAQGLTVTGTSHGCSGNAMNSPAFNSKQIWYRYVSSTGPNGNIQTTKEANFNGKLNDSNVLGPGTYVVAEGKTVTYTMTPHIGYKLMKIEINGKPLKFNGEDVNRMKKGDSLETTTAAGKKGILKYEEDGTYTFVFEHAKHDENIHVEWEPTTADIFVSKRWQDNNDQDGLRAEAYSKTESKPVLKLQKSIDSGRTWSDVHENAVHEPVAEQIVPDGKDSSDKYKDGLYAINMDTSGNHPFTWEYLPVYNYDSNGTADTLIQYRIVEVPDPATTGYRKAQYFDEQPFNLSSQKTKSVYGRLIYIDSNNKLYVKRSDEQYYEVGSDGVESQTAAEDQPSFEELTPVSSSAYYTADKGIHYQSVEVRDEHAHSKIYIEFTKKWDDENVYEKTAAEVNQYKRKDLRFILHGEINDGTAVDLNGSDEGNDIKVIIKTDETDRRETATGSGGDRTYRIDTSRFGALIEDLPAYQEGKLITYTLTETDEDGKPLHGNGWIVTGGNLTPVYDSSNELEGYTSEFVNTPDIKEKRERLPLTIQKIDSVTGQALPGATFTVYSDVEKTKKAKENDFETIEGKTVYTDGNNKYIIKSDGLTEKYFMVDEDGDVAEDPADPQPDSDSLKESKDPMTGAVDENAVVTDANGLATFNFNEEGTYFVTETNAPKGYKKDENTYRFVIDKELKSVTYKSKTNRKWWEILYDFLFGEGTTSDASWQMSPDKKSGTLTVKNDPIRANILVKKTWNDDNDRDGLRGNTQTIMPKVSLQKTTDPDTTGSWVDVDSEAVPAPDKDVPNKDAAITNDEEQYYTWMDLPAYENGKPIYYRVVEKGGKLPDGTDLLPEVADPELTGYGYTSKTAVGSEAEFNIATDEAKPVPRNRTVIVTNTHIPQTISIKAFKKWVDDDGSKRSTALLTLYKIVDNTTTTLSETGEVVTDPESGTPVHTWEDLPVYENGKEISYRINEAEIEGYSASYAVSYKKSDGSDVSNEKANIIKASDIIRSGESAATASFTVTNTELQNITTQKYWINGANANVRFRIYRSTEPTDIENWPGDLNDPEKSKKWELIKGAEHLFVSSAFSIVTESPGDEETHVFENLPKYDEDGILYTYRVLETTTAGSVTDDRYDTSYDDTGLIVTNTNKHMNDGTADVDVIKDLQGRKWLDNDVFYFRIEPIKGYDETSDSPIEFDDSAQDQEKKAKVPLPGKAHLPVESNPGYVVGTAKEVNTEVAVTGREVSFSPIIYTYEDAGGLSSQEIFYYKVYEVADSDGLTPVPEKDDRGITYDGTRSGDNWNYKTSILKVVVTSDFSGKVTTEHYWDYDKPSGKWKITTPSFVNKYSSEGVAKIWIEKEIKNRSWKNYSDPPLLDERGDAFQFEISSISGSKINMPGETSQDSYITRPITSNTTGWYDYHEDKRQPSDSVVIAGIAGNPYTGEMLNSEGWSYFIYSIDELVNVNENRDAGKRNIENYSVDGLNYDDTTIYVRLKATDNWDGTISFDVEYFSDASCRKAIDSDQVWIHDSDNIEQRVMLNDEQIQEAIHMTPEQREAAGYRQVNVAKFVNTTTTDVPVMKVWEDGPAVENVTLHLHRHLFDLDSVDESLINQQYVENAAKGDPDFWEAIGLVHNADRGDFTTESKKTYLEEGFNKELPMYVKENGKYYRAVYRLTEDDTSDAYEREYSSRKGLTTTDGNNIYIDGETLFVTNKVVATNTANIAAVKQLLGRDWKKDDSGDEFKFILESDGIAVYDDDDEIIAVDRSDAAKSRVPMPAVSEASAKPSTQIVDKNGGLERLARFGSIEYKVSDLVYDKKDKHMQGDFFYTMKEKIPDDAVNNEGVKYSEATDEQKDNGGFKLNGITYDSDTHTVHVKVRENRTGNLQVQVAYDESTEGDIDSGTPFTPVFTNRYGSEEAVTVKVHKHMMGRDWYDGETFDFIMMPIGGAPFVDANEAGETTPSSDFPAKNKDSGSKNDIQNALEEGLSAHILGGHIKRLTVSSAIHEPNPQSLEFPAIKFNYTDLHNKVEEGDKEVIKDKNGDPLPAGTAYSRFMYAFTETDEYWEDTGNRDVNIDKDTEYGRITVYDVGDGELEHYVEFFEDRYGKNPRFEPDPETGEPTTTPAVAAPFVNQWKRDLSATKAWHGNATEDVTLRLQWSVDDEHFWDVDGTAWLAGIKGNVTISKNAKGKDLIVTWKDLPAYANISDASDCTGETGDDNNLNDKWIYYQVVEDPPSKSEVRYNKTKYTDGDEITNTAKYKEIPFHTGDEKIDGKYPDTKDRIKMLYVTNFPGDIEGKAQVGVVKQYIGKEWDDETFTFRITPVKSMIGSETSAVNEGGDRIVEYRNKEDGSTISVSDYGKLPDEEKGKYEPVTKKNLMPSYGSDNKATASKRTSKVSVNEHSADFEELTIKRSDLALDSKGTMRGTFLYKITEVVPDGAEITNEVCGKDVDGNDVYYYAGEVNGNRVKYTTEEHMVKIVAVDDGGGDIDITVSFDDRKSGEYVPVYTNFALEKTPIEGSKTWSGGADDEHVNGSVSLNDDQTEIINSSDGLALKLQRKPDKKGAEVSDVSEDDVGNEIVIVWVSEDRETEEGEIRYIPQTKGDGTYTVKAKIGNQFVDPVLDTVDEDGNKYIYSVVEANIPDGYKVSYNGMDVTNTDDSGSVDVVVSKKWDDSKNQDGKRPDSVTVRITADGWNGKDINNKTVGDKKLSDDNNWKSAFRDLPEKNKAGDKYDYIISEDPVPDEYSASVKYQSSGNKSWSTTKPDDWNGKAVITNSYVPSDRSISATKVWDGETEEVGTSLRTDVILHLYGKDENGLIVYDAGTKKISKDAETESERTVTWNKIPKRHYSNKDLTWEVTEEPVYGYTTEIRRDVENNFTVTNTYAEPVTKVTAKKIWDDEDVWEDEDYANRPEKVTFELWRKVGDGDPEKVAGADKTVSEDSPTQWTAVWKNLPVVEKQESDTTSEKERVEYKQVQKTDEDGKLIFKDSQTGKEVAVTVEEAEAEDSEYKDTTKYEPVMTEEEVPVTETETVTETVEVPILYMVKEVPIDDDHYAKPVYRVTAPGEFEVVNSFIKETVDVPVKKIWSDNENSGGHRPDHITLSLRDNTHDKIVRHVELSAEDQPSPEARDTWVHRFMGLPKYDENGAKIGYTVEEKKVLAYDVSISEDGEGGYIVTNTHNVGAKTSLTVTKKWEGDEADKSDRTSVKMQLIEVIEGSKKEIGEPVTLEFDKSNPDKPMKYTWDDLDTIYHGKNGEHVVTYTVEEKPVKGYTGSVSDTKERFDEVTPKPDDSPKAQGWYEKDEDGKYHATKDDEVVDGKTYYEKHFTVTVTNTKGEIPLRGDVIYVDPKNPIGKNAMIVKSTSYKNPETARAAAQSRKDAPANPKHNGVKFVGWDLNWDENGNYVLVATYSDIPTTVTPVTTYIDPLSGKPVLISELTNDPSSVTVPNDPRHKNVQFAGWVKSVDAGGNTIFVAKFEPDCANRSNTNGDGKKVRTGDEENAAMLWVVVMILSAILLSVYVTQRTRENRSRR